MNEIEERIQVAVREATRGVLAGIELKIQKAFELGAEIGAAKGAEMGAQAALQAAEEERKRLRRIRHDKQLRNTRLLLKHYRSLNSHYANAVWEDEDEPQEETFADILELMTVRNYSDEVIVDSIRASSRKTRIIMRHVNAMLREYEKQCAESERPEDRRRWRVIKALYLDEGAISALAIAEKNGIDKRTVYKDADAAVERLTTLFFGVDGIEKL